MAILYIETNFVVGAARGQDPDADALLGVPSKALRILLPSVCVMETLSREESLDRTQRCGGEAKGFLSANKTDFDTPEVRRALQHAGITHYFTATGHALGWARAGCRE